MTVPTQVMRWGTILGVGGASAAVALWMRSMGIFSAGAAMVALRANAPASFETVGLDLPPLPVILSMPLGFLPALRWDPLGPAVVSATAAGIAAWWLFGALRAMGVRTAAALLIAAGAVLHPGWVYAAASGSGTVLASALLVAALRLHRRWQGSGEAVAILASSFAMALGGLARYDFFLVGWAVALLVLRGSRARPKDPRDERPAFSVAYAAAVTGTLGLWLVTVGTVTGDPLAFIGASRDALAAPSSSNAPVHALVVIVPALLLAALAAVLRRGQAATVSMAVITSAAVGASIVSGSPLSLDAVLPLVPLSALLAGEIVAAHLRLRPLVALAVPGLVLSGAVAVALSPDWGEGHRATLDALAGRARPMWQGERDLAAGLRAASGRVVVDQRIDGVATLLLASPHLVAPVDPGTTPPRADLVLVRTPAGRGSAHRVAAAWPTLYSGGAPWAQLVGSWPVSGEPGEYRLYAVQPVGVSR